MAAETRVPEQEARSFPWMRLIARTVSFLDDRSDSLTRNTEMINDKRRRPHWISGNGLEDAKKKDWISNPTKQPEAGNYPIKFFRATKKEEGSPPLYSLSLNDSFVLIVSINQILIILSNFTFSWGLTTTCWELL